MPDRVALFPLGHTVLFPGVVLPLHVFEQRYRELVGELVAAPEGTPRRFGVVAIRQGWEVGADAVRALYGVGCTAELRKVSRYPDGRYDLVTVGVDRFRLLEVDAASRPYLVGTVRWLPADPPDDEATLLVGGVGTLFADYVAAVAAAQGATARTAELPAELPDPPSALSYLVAAAAALTLEDRQALLEAAGATERLRTELRLLKREITMLRRLRALPTSLAELGVTPGVN